MFSLHLGKGMKFMMKAQRYMMVDASLFFRLRYFFSDNDLTGFYFTSFVS